MLDKLADIFEMRGKSNAKRDYAEEVFFNNIDKSKSYPVFDYKGDSIPLGHAQYYSVTVETVGVMYFNTYKKLPNLVGGSDFVKFTEEVVTFLKENATIICKHNTPFNRNYLFDYKKNFIAVFCNLHRDKDELDITLSLQHSLDVPCVYNELVKFRKFDENKCKLGILKRNNYGGIEVARQDFLDDKLFNLNHYNKEFKTFYTAIKDKLATTQSGLYLLHGTPGTGKTSFIRHLTSQVDREFIFIPPQMVSSLTSPDFTSLLTSEHSGSILIIEDAEAAMMKRSDDTNFHNSEIVSSLLNLTDGLYADVTKVSIIATYNCERNKIDEALLRKGRLKAEYEFTKLNVERSQDIFDTRGIEYKVTEPMTLADIFSHEDLVSNVERESEKPKRSIGFGR